MITILLAENRPNIIKAWQLLLRTFADINVFGMATDGEMVVQLADSLEPDVILMDTRMPKIDGLEATRRILKNHAGIRIIGMSTIVNQELVHALMESGAAGFLAKDADIDEVVKAIRKVHAGGQYVS